MLMSLIDTSHDNVVPILGLPAHQQVATSTTVAAAVTPTGTTAPTPGATVVITAAATGAADTKDTTTDIPEKDPQTGACVCTNINI